MQRKTFLTHTLALAAALFAGAASAQATALQRKLAQESDEKMFAELKARGVQIDKVDQGPFMKATAPVVAKWEAGPIGPFVKKVVAAARAK